MKKYLLSFVVLLSQVGAEMDLHAKIWVAGHRGLVGSAIVSELKEAGYDNIITRSHKELDLCDQEAVRLFYEEERPEYVFVAAAHVGGILANMSRPVDFLYDNLAIQTNVIHNAHLFRVKKLLFLGSSCIYPRECAQPMKEEYLLTGALEPTNEWYAVAKISGLKMCQAYKRQYGDNFISLMPTNLYGPNDNFDLQNSHVLPALIRKFVEAKERNLSEVVVWGTGAPKREFLFSRDLAKAALLAMNSYDGEMWLNVGTGQDVTIKELTELVAKVVGFNGSIVWDSEKPDGMPRKLLDVSKINALGWKATTPLEEGIAETVAWYCDHL